jgi:hypothetical protein
MRKTRTRTKSGVGSEGDIRGEGGSVEFERILESGLCSRLLEEE